jgi:hypothetical protein
MIQTALKPMRMIERVCAAAKGGIFFVGDQFLFFNRRDGQDRFKYLSPVDAACAFSQIEMDSGWLAPEVVRTGWDSRGVWSVLFVPARVTPLLIENGNETLKIQVPLPGLVFTNYGIGCHIWAVTGKKFSPEAKVFHAPLPNISSGGQICFGMNHLEREKGIEHAWKLFLASPFNSHQSDNKCKSQPGDVRRLLLDLQNKKLFPPQELLPGHQTVNLAFKNIWRGRS